MKNIALVLSAIVIIACAGCGSDDDTTAMQMQTASNQIGQINDLKQKNSALEMLIEAVRANNAILTNTVGSLDGENAVLKKRAGELNNSLTNLVGEISALKQKSTNQDSLICTLTNMAESLISENAGLKKEADALKARLTAVTLAATAPPTPAGTNAVPVASGANIIAVVKTAGTSSIVFYQDGTVIATNALVGMIDGFPVLVDNTSSKTVTLTLKRVVGPGSVTLEVQNNTNPTIYLLQGQYNCTWRIKDRGEIAGTCTMTVSEGEPADLVVGKGVFNATLTLVNK